MTAAGPAAGAVAGEIAVVRAEHGRADGKAAVLLTAAGVAASVLAAGHGGRLAGWAVVAWSVCGALALAVVTPRLRRRGARGGFPAYAAATPQTVLGWVDPGGPGDDLAAAAYLIALSRLAVVKYRLVQAAVTAAAAALALTAGALL